MLTAAAKQVGQHALPAEDSFIYDHTCFSKQVAHRDESPLTWECTCCICSTLARCALQSKLHTFQSSPEQWQVQCQAPPVIVVTESYCNFWHSCAVFPPTAVQVAKSRNIVVNPAKQWNQWCALSLLANVMCLQTVPFPLLAYSFQAAYPAYAFLASGLCTLALQWDCEPTQVTAQTCRAGLPNSGN